jgi:hypothetical protein
MKTLSILSLVVLFASCSSGWTDEKRQKIVDKCDVDTYDCDCFVENTVVFFPDPETYNTTLENEEENAVKYNEYQEVLNDCKKPDVWDMIYGNCDTNIYDCDCFLEITMEFYPEWTAFLKDLQNEANSTETLKSYREMLEGGCEINTEG